MSRLTLVDAAERSRMTVDAVRAALASGDLRALTVRDVDSWRRAVLAARIVADPAGDDR